LQLARLVGLDGGAERRQEQLADDAHPGRVQQTVGKGALEARWMVAVLLLLLLLPLRWRQG
jgi:hypothetical protein